MPSPHQDHIKGSTAAQLIFLSFFFCRNNHSEHLPDYHKLCYTQIASDHVLLRRKRYLLRRPPSTHLRASSLRTSPLQQPTLRPPPLRASTPRTLLLPIPSPLRGTTTTLPHLLAAPLGPPTPSPPTTPPPRLDPRMGADSPPRILRRDGNRPLAVGVPHGRRRVCQGRP